MSNAMLVWTVVSGEPFAAGWVWTPELERLAPTPYDHDEKPVGYRQLASQAIGSEICTVPDFARFVAAAVSGPGGEPPGRGVLKRETISTMIDIQPNARNAGLGYGIVSSEGEKILTHSERILAGWPIFASASIDEKDLSSRTIPPAEESQRIHRETVVKSMS